MMNDRRINVWIHRSFGRYKPKKIIFQNVHGATGDEERDI